MMEPPSLGPALEGISHVIHCAGKTKALRAREYYSVNQIGTRHLVEAVNRHRQSLQRLIHISSLAASKPASAELPAREDDPPAPVSQYGQSKLAAEHEIRERCLVGFTILRPAAVYGPRDRDFLTLVKGLRFHVLPTFGGGRQPISLLFAPDLASAVAQCLRSPIAAGRTYHLASPEVVTPNGLALEMARHLGVRTLHVPLPLAMLWVLCGVRQALSQLTGHPHILSLQKCRELCAPGWVCDTRRLRNDLGFVAPTTLSEGIGQTLNWYRTHGWL